MNFPIRKRVSPLSIRPDRKLTETINISKESLYQGVKMTKTILKEIEGERERVHMHTGEGEGEEKRLGERERENLPSDLIYLVS